MATAPLSGAGKTWRESKAFTQENQLEIPPGSRGPRAVRNGKELDSRRQLLYIALQKSPRGALPRAQTGKATVLS